LFLFYHGSFNFLFAIAFTLELVAYLVGYGLRQSANNNWVRFDAVVVFISWFSYLVDFGNFSGGLRVLRLTRLAKVFLRKAAAMNKAHLAETLGLHPQDTALGAIDADEYATVRLSHAAAVLRKSLTVFYWQHISLRTFSYLLAGLTTVLALPGADLSIWNIPLFSLIDVCNRVLAISQCATRLKEGNTAVLKLTEISSWWSAQGYAGKIKTKNISRLVHVCEEALLHYEASSLQAVRVVARTNDDIGEDMDTAAYSVEPTRM